jgi:hypothetical protein
MHAPHQVELAHYQGGGSTICVFDAQGLFSERVAPDAPHKNPASIWIAAFLRRKAGMALTLLVFEKLMPDVPELIAAGELHIRDITGEVRIHRPIS